MVLGFGGLFGVGGWDASAAADEFVSFSAKDLLPLGFSYESVVPETLDLAQRAEDAVGGLSRFLDGRNHHSTFCHGFLCTNAPFMVHDRGQSQNWGKVVDGLILLRQLCGSDDYLDVELDSLLGMMDYAVPKMQEPFPVPLARMTMTLISLHQQVDDAKLAAAIDAYKNALIAKVKVDAEQDHAYFGPRENRWQQGSSHADMGHVGFSTQLFTAGTVLRTLVMCDQVANVEVDAETMRLLRNYIMEPRYWQVEDHPQMVIPAEHGQFIGHMHSYTQALLGLLYYAHHTGDARALALVRSSYEYMRTFGLARIGLFGEGCAVGDMTYLAVRLSQWGVGDYWEDVDQYVRNHLIELQITDTAPIQRIVEEHGTKLDSIKLDSWHQGVDKDDVLNRCRGIFFSDATHPTLIPLRREHIPNRSCMQWVVCCSGNCSKALHVVASSIADFDAEVRTAKINLLLNRATPWLDVNSFLPYEGRVVVINKLAETLLVRMPRWTNKGDVTCEVDGVKTPFSWVGNYALVGDVKAGDTIEFAFPIVKSTEKYRVAWREEEFWQESNQPPPSWGLPRAPKQYTMQFRGNTLVHIEPRDTQIGYALYADRSPEKYDTKVSLEPRHRFVYRAKELIHTASER